MVILGINAYHGDVSAGLLRDGELVCAVEEERFQRVKHWAGFPSQSIRSCLEVGGLRPQDVDFFAISRNPRANLLRKGFFTLRNRPRTQLLKDRVRNSLRVHRLGGRLAQELEVDPRQVQERIRWVEHHPCHLASSFFVSPFEEAAVCAVDGFGDFVSTSCAVGRGNRLQLLQRIYFPHSLGMLYLALTQYLGFPRYGDEYKVMGLAAYGRPEFTQALQRLIHLKAGGGFELDLSFFRHHSEGVDMSWEDGEPSLGPVYSRKLEELLGPARGPDEPIQSRHEAIAASLQQVFEETFFHLLNALYEKTRLPRLCLAGGCALNSVANGKICERTPFKEIYIQPAAADNGTSLGAAAYLYHQLLRQPRQFSMGHAYWGPAFSQAQCEEELRMKSEELKRRGCRMTTLEDAAALCRHTAQRLAEGKIVGWFQGRMEWGPRALGNRSILADPRDPQMREKINTKIKFRERFRPFASSILKEKVSDYFVGASADPFMVQVYPVRPERRHAIPAVTHVDGSGRLQAVSPEDNPLYWKLLKTFEEETGVPILLNTSFNENEPIVHQPQEALECFLRTGLDALVLGTTILEKNSVGR